MKTISLPLGQLQTNCYLVWDESTHQGIIIDPGDEGTFIIDKIQQLNLKPQLIIATHGHFDHLLGVLELKLAFNIPFALHEKDLPHLTKAHRSARYWLNITPDPIPQPDIFFTSSHQSFATILSRFASPQTGQKSPTPISKGAVNFGNQSLKIIPTPGHTPGSICLYSSKDHLLFTGDTLFAQGGVGRTDLSGGNPALLRQSLTRLFQLPPKTVIRPGHGPQSTLGTEQELHHSS
jgi:hydroxyacylglutathione hydrolase